MKYQKYVNIYFVIGMPRFISPTLVSADVVVDLFVYQQIRWLLLMSVSDFNLLHLTYCTGYTPCPTLLTRTKVIYL